MRARPIVAIAQRDLYWQLRGRRGWLYPFIAALILIPAAIAPLNAELPTRAEIPVKGDVPERVLALDRVAVNNDRPRLQFEQTNDALVVHGRHIPDDVREALDGDTPSLTVHDVEPPVGLPGRSLVLTLIASSILTGALSESIPGERSQRTLQTLLTAAVTRSEIVTGKWLAWGGFGALASAIAVALSMVSGYQSPGWWLIPVMSVPMATVALGLYLARHATDVVGGATVSMRVLPAALTIGGLAAWGLGRWHPWLGASVPIGGALVASGDTWPGFVTPILATAVTLGFTAAALGATARDLEDDTPENRFAGQVQALVTTSLAASAWWMAIAGPMVWTMGGNEALTSRLSPTAGVLAGGLGIGIVALIRFAEPSPPRTPAITPSAAWLLALPAGLLLFALSNLSGNLSFEGAWLTPVAARMSAALNPVWAGIPVFLVAVWAQEALFRGWILRQAGPVVSVAAWVVVISPLDPVVGIATGAVLVGITRFAGGLTLVAVVARVVWGLAAAV